MQLESSRKLIKIHDFYKLSDEVKSCQLCPRMCNSARILGLSSGSLESDVMFIGEAPGRLGADETGIPFHGDRAGDNFEELLDFVGLSRNDIFVTNAVLCNPKDENGNNSTPTNVEIDNCKSFLQRQIELINPKIVVTLGANALKATSLISKHELTLKASVRTENAWFGRKLIPLYHPGQRAMLHRSFANQRSDYQFVADAYKKIGLKPRSYGGKTKAAVKTLAESILKEKGEVSYFALHKMAYLIEWEYARTHGDRLTGAYFIRQKDGPYCPELSLSRLKNSIAGLEIVKKQDKYYLRSMPKGLFGEELISNEISTYVHERISAYIVKSDAELKTSAYMTRPMRNILVKERSLAVNMYNSPISFI